MCDIGNYLLGETMQNISTVSEHVPPNIVHDNSNAQYCFQQGEKIMLACGWYKEIHTILGKKIVRWHKDGFEIEEKDVLEIILKAQETVKDTRIPGIIKTTGNPGKKL